MTKYFHLNGSTGDMMITTSNAFSTISANPAAYESSINFHSKLNYLQIKERFYLASKTYASLALETIYWSSKGLCSSSNYSSSMTNTRISTTLLGNSSLGYTPKGLLLYVGGVPYPEGYRHTTTHGESTLIPSYKSGKVYLLEYTIARSGTLTASTLSNIEVYTVG